MLYGPKEGMLGLAWHPSRPFVATCSKRRQGVYMWNKRYAEDWTAFAPNVTKLLENIEYVEKEDEFDLVTRGHHRQGCQLCRVCVWVHSCTLTLPLLGKQVTEAQALVSTDNDVIAGQLPAHLQQYDVVPNCCAPTRSVLAAHCELCLLLLGAHGQLVCHCKPPRSRGSSCSSSVRRCSREHTRGCCGRLRQGRVKVREQAWRQ